MQYFKALLLGIVGMTASILVGEFVYNALLPHFIATDHFPIFFSDNFLFDIYLFIIFLILSSVILKLVYHKSLKEIFLYLIFILLGAVIPVVIYAIRIILDLRNFSF